MEPSITEALIQLEKYYKIHSETSSETKNPVPSITQLSNLAASPFQILVSTIISLRTRDAVTLQASLRLFQVASTANEIAELPVEKIEDIIYPCGFFRNKAFQIKEISKILIKEHNGQVPSSREELIALPGIGPKTAALVLGLAYSIPAICVDIHVHRISNRLGWIKTSSPEDTEEALMKLIPESYWIRLNTWMVFFGQTQCQPVSPFCRSCELSSLCSREGVVSSR